MVFDPVKKMLVVFRKYANKRSVMEAIELTKVITAADLMEVRENLIEKQKVEIIKEVLEEWTMVYNKRAIWTVKALTAKWTTPPKVTTSRLNNIFLRDAPTCHSDDHHQTKFPW